MERSNRSPANGHASPVRLFLITTALIFVAEALVMFFLPVLPPLSLYEEMIIDSLLLSLLISPLLHFTLFRPMVAEVTDGWVFGEVWVPSADGTHLRFSPAWYCKDEGLERFRKASEQFAFPPGVGLPGRAWSDKKSVWIVNVTLDTNFPRAPLALKMGLKGAMAIPILSEGKVVAVMDFFAFEALGKEDKRPLDAVSAIAIQLGSLIKRKMMEEEMERSKRHSRPLSLLMFDIDHFKDVNDTYGHGAGDYVLKTIAELVRKNMRKIDYFVRWGGEEFIIIAKGGRFSL